MYSDTHCHLKHISERGEDLRALIAELDAARYRFVLDVGTKPGDFTQRVEIVARACADDPNAASSGERPEAITASALLPGFIHFSVGLWPDAGTIENRAEALRVLEADVRAMLDLANERGKNGTAQFAALGECGLDRFWNGAAARERMERDSAAASSTAASSTGAASDDGPGTVDLAGEEELFGLQLDMAKRHSLPAIIHSRDAFDATLGCIRDSGYDVGVIHCFSYGIREARAFLDQGWYLSFPGNITWPKRDADRVRVRELLNYVPRDRLLLETDAPYLAPAPHRGKTNTPYLVRHVYERAAECLGLAPEALADIVYENARALFLLRQGSLR